MTNKERIRKVLSKDGIYYAVYYLLKFLHIDRLLSDKLYVMLQYRCYTGRRLNLKNPQRFNEKLCWLKLYDHNPFYTTLVDKYEVKQYIAERIGSEYVIPTLARWNCPEDIDISALPNQFVLKTNHSGNNNGVVICKNKATFNFSEAIEKLRKSYHSNMYLAGREWPYKNVHRCVFAEAYMEDSETAELRDYKFFCFNGEVKTLLVNTEKDACDGIKFDFFDENFNPLGITTTHQTSGKSIRKPSQFEIMKKIAQILSQGMPFVRVDLYEVNQKVYFGELTLYTSNGTSDLHPDKWNDIFGQYIDLSLLINK